MQGGLGLPVCSGGRSRDERAQAVGAHRRLLPASHCGVFRKLVVWVLTQAPSFDLDLLPRLFPPEPPPPPPLFPCRFNFDAVAASNDLSGLQTLPKRMLPA